uniref:AAA ATPase n=1 Tax=uncultured euryarchaeote Rifle_16ft_4_minimus_23719 TaxID=1665190 RepID=A0A0H4T4S0_9EURY|nr:AAA ATPase [uncultured euryarchaeote Rifle_16ft_4_minimus_23719]
MGKEDRDAWVVKCPKCGRIRESCRHVSADDVRRIVRLLKAGVEVYEKDEALPEEGHVHEPPARPLARAVRPRVRLEDLVLPEATRDALEDALAEVRHQRLMYQRWGLRKVVRKAKGVALLFAGPPGTGKTMAAEAIARELGRPLHVVDYAQLENMWVGETEKNIDAVFERAAREEAVLFFDEADSVFHRRGSGMAPWTNRDVNVLLNRLENHPGVTILATNLGRILDRALDRRVDVAVEFGLPDAGMRRELYRRLVPRGAPVAKDVDFEWLARRYALSGGSILNVVRGALRSAARRGGRRRVTMGDFVRAAEREARKAGLLAADHLAAEPRRERIRGYA